MMESQILELIKKLEAEIRLTDRRVAQLSEIAAGELSPHALVGDKHTASGLTSGHFLKATGASSFVFQAHGLNHSDLGGIGATDHHSNANDPLAGEKAALAGTSGTPGSGNKYVTDADSRNSNARTPTAHASTHKSGGSDSIKLDELATPDDNTNLNATTSRHGLLLKLGGGTTNFLRADGSWAAPPSGGSVAALTTTAKARAYRSGNIGAASAAWTKLALNAETYDPGSNFDSSTNYRFVAPVAGYYMILAQIYFLNSSTGSRRMVSEIRVNGTGKARFLDDNIAAGGDIEHSGGSILYLAQNDYVEMFYYVSGADVLIIGQEHLTALAVHLISY